VLFGLANTLILLTSSWMVVEAVHAARARNGKKVTTNLTLALVLGIAFAVSKVIEYHSKFTHGITPATNPFFSFYFFITVVHFLHVVAGMMFILHFRNAAKSSLDSSRYLSGLENVGLFWHYVDVLWIFIFPLLYLVGRK
jgi:nitric oxide reductase NorE protein